MMEIVVALENTVVPHDPFILLADEWGQQVRGNGGVVVGRENVADIVQQGAYDGLVICAITSRSRGRLHAICDPLRFRALLSV